MEPTVRMLPGYPPFPNKFQRKLIVFMLLVKHPIQFKDQRNIGCYENRKAFKFSMAELHEMKICTFRQRKLENGGYDGNEYKLTIQGEHLGEILHAICK